jgi:site-specific DNA-cytosine methylase
VLDAQHFGVPQRRRRIFAVASLGDGAHPGSVLFERESLRGDSAASRKARKGSAAAAGEGAAVGRGRIDCTPAGITGTLSSKWSKGTGGPAGDEHYNLVCATGSVTHALSTGSSGCTASIAVATAMQVRHLPQCPPSDTFVATGGGTHDSGAETRSREVLQLMLGEIGAEAFFEWGTGVAASFLPQEVLQRDLHGCGVRCKTPAKSVLGSLPLPCAEVGPGRAVRCLWEAGRDRCPPPGWGPHEQRSHQLAAYLSELSHSRTPWQEALSDMRQTIAETRVLRDARAEIQEVGQSASREGQSVCAATAGFISDADSCLRVSSMFTAVSREWLLQHARTAPSAGDTRLACRRLTPLEAERLQGFPDGWTDIPFRNKPAADGPRYKALGNSMAVPVMRWIGQRIQLIGGGS